MTNLFYCLLHEKLFFIMSPIYPPQSHAKFIFFIPYHDRRLPHHKCWFVADLQNNNNKTNNNNFLDDLLFKFCFRFLWNLFEKILVEFLKLTKFKILPNLQFLMNFKYLLKIYIFSKNSDKIFFKRNSHKTYFPHILTELCRATCPHFCCFSSHVNHILYLFIYFVLFSVHAATNNISYFIFHHCRPFTSFLSLPDIVKSHVCRQIVTRGGDFFQKFHFFSKFVLLF